MKERAVQEDIMLFQVFLNDTQVPSPSVFEVGLTLEDKLVCTCPNYKGRGKCKHVNLVQLRMDMNDGIYEPSLSKNVTEADVALAKLSTKHNREFLLKFGIPEVL